MNKIEELIKQELVNKEYNEWTKDSILLLLSIFEKKEYTCMREVGILLFEQYIAWYKQYPSHENMYTLQSLESIYVLVVRDVYLHEYYTYEDLLQSSSKDLLPNPSLESISFDCFMVQMIRIVFESIASFFHTDIFHLMGGIFCMLLYFMIRSIYFLFCRKIDPTPVSKHILEFRIPLPEMISNFFIHQPAIKNIISAFLQKYHLELF